ncbi:serologically defined colon cancer antigen 8 homolog isoform X4 [Spodoptera litura]|uniref:Serologically defined colon cancer antigen 8 homolog isoform X4 n=1 Tax=Spodoptera litura TaxID=69820 RepID=A0A9J7EHG0_SPOLT|nr:serologically defined colon cancer antigen 8 homolog isoform X4 [Spodoptera litura]
MGSTSYVTKPKSTGYRVKSGSSVGSDKEMSAKLKRTKIRRPSKMNEYGLKRIPDYTELAYKEAVSKLRYFLSGNYAPSVRSYGGSASVKNLDESDGDLDKKYTSSYTLAEYKPRPRLTTKYATLYADSLNNYTPPHVNTTSVPPATATAGDVTGGTNPDVINFIQKQEEYIEQLERESQYCRDELNNLLGKVKEVISENEHLHEAQKNKLISRMFHSYNGSESDDLDELGDSTGLDSDNKTTPLKARKSAKARSTRLEGPNIVFESRIAELEAQLTQSKIDLKKVQEENNENKRKLASGLVDSTCLDGFKRQIDNLQRDKSSLESQISKLKLSLEQRDDDGRYKRGSDAVEHQLREERNNLEAELRRLKDDLAKERSKVRELAGEGARRAIQERSAAEQRYNAHFDELQHDLAAQYDNVAKLQLDLERQRREENELKRELSMKNAAIDELKMELKNKISSLQADLAQAHAEKASLEEELASARLAIERQQRQAKHETNRLNSEIQSLRQRLDRADADLVHSRRENLRLSEQISNLEKEQTMKNLTPISPEKNKKEKELSTMLESMENKHGSAQCRGRSDEPIRTQRDRSSSRDRETRRSKRRSAKESVSSNNYAPIVVGPLTTNQDLTNIKGEKIYNLPLMIQQPFLREKKEPIKVDISVKLVPKPRKKEKKRRGAHVEEIIVQQADDNRGIKNSFSMEVSEGDIQVLNETVEIIEDNAKASEEVDNKDSHSVEENAQVQEQNDINIEQILPTETTDDNNVEMAEVAQDTANIPQESTVNQDEITENVNIESEIEKETDAVQEKDEQKDEEAA